MGLKVKGISLGIWSEKSTYSQNELRNVWIMVYVDKDSEMTMEEDSAFYKKSHLKISQGKKLVKDIRISGAVDGPVGVGFAGGVSADLKDLVIGDYQLVLEIDSRISDTIDIAITK